MALKDLPTFIDFILETTSLSNLSYIGHSEGATQMFLGASLNPDSFNEKVNLFIALAPVASTVHISNPIIKHAASLITVLELALVRKEHYYNWFAPMPMADGAIAAACDIVPGLCKEVGQLIHPKDGVDNPARFDVFMSNEPSGQSYRTFVYYAQQMNSGRVALYDYGPIENHKVYGQKEAPLVPFENYSLPTALLSGDIDGLATPSDVAWTSQTLADSIVFEKQYHADHFTFAIGKDMSFFSEDAVNLLHKYNPVSAEYLQ